MEYRARLTRCVLCVGLGLAGLSDLQMYRDAELVDHLPVHPLVSGPIAVLLLWLSFRRGALEWSTGIAVGGSLLLTTALGLTHPAWVSMLETSCLLILLVRVIYRVPRPAAVVALCAALCAALTALPVRQALEPHDVYDGAAFSGLLASAAIGLGFYLRMLDGRRTAAIAAARHNERLELARELHDFVAHHATAIVIQAQAARTIRETAPEQIDGILENIERAGVETMESMNHLVSLLREDTPPPVQPGEFIAHLTKLVADFSRSGDSDAILRVTAPARQVLLTSKVQLAIQRVILEALTNARRHAPGAPVTVSVTVRKGRLCVEVSNKAPVERPRVLAAGGGGFGLVGMRERVAGVGGELLAGTAADGGWRVAGIFPTVIVTPSDA
ncbi:sensor histidine kinase [Nonomuraea basaltis]|uniref:sensor histidine kinase n=1 Tax=Nonomuraea basaltis TaxID=2495887 RepID=UPI00110C5D4B|nr:histidine kinase [Nonomuraea basaltis]TMR96448.1 two-component sensor histidine kinase [Nonomuraea basaltis]